MFQLHCGKLSTKDNRIQLWFSHKMAVVVCHVRYTVFVMWEAIFHAFNHTVVAEVRSESHGNDASLGPVMSAPDGWRVKIIPRVVMERRKLKSWEKSCLSKILAIPNQYTRRALSLNSNTSCRESRKLSLNFGTVPEWKVSIDVSIIGKFQCIINKGNNSKYEEIEMCFLR
jgi:hypothetical protein